jgi:hypothetical protein
MLILFRILCFLFRSHDSVSVHFLLGLKVPSGPPHPQELLAYLGGLGTSPHFIGCLLGISPWKGRTHSHRVSSVASAGVTVLS